MRPRTIAILPLAALLAFGCAGGGGGGEASPPPPAGPNLPPVFDAIADATIPEDAGLQALAIGGISPVEAGQVVTVTAASSDPAIVPDPAVTGSGATRTLTYAPAANRSGTATIAVRARDDGGTLGGGIDVFTRTFAVTVQPVNDPPSFTTPGPQSGAEDTPGTIAIADVRPGPAAALDEAGQVVTFQATSSDPAILPQTGLAVTGSGATRTLSYAPAAEKNGTVVVTLVASDGQAANGQSVGTQQVTLTIAAVNDPPEFRAPGAQTGARDVPGTVVMAEARAGPAGAADEHATQTLAFSATASDPTFFTSLTVTSVPPTGPPGGTATLSYRPAPGRTGAVTVTVVADDGQATNPLATQQFSLIVTRVSTHGAGIPDPDFGFEEVDALYGAATFDFGAGPVPYPDAGSGPYTHYVDRTAAGATDSANAFGSPAKPRLTIPQNLTAGAVVEIHGGPYTYGIGGRVPVTGAGTALKPIFIRGASATSRPVFSGSPMRAEGSYLIFENLVFDGPSTGWAARASAGSTVHHLALRGCELRNISGTAVGVVGYIDTATDLVHDVVLFRNEIHDLGTSSSAIEKDWHCVLVGMNARDVWILENALHHNQGDGVQINFFGHGANQVPAQFVYIGRNTIHHNQENCLDFKVCQDVIVSENELSDIAPTPSAAGEIVVTHDDNGTPAFPCPLRLWFLYNHLHHGELGFVHTSNGDLIYIVGNVIRDIVATEPLRRDSPFSPGAAIVVRQQQSVHIHNNTIYGCDLGVLSAYTTGGLDMANNVIANLTGNHEAQFGTQAFQILIESSTVAASSDFHHGLIDQGADPVRLRWGGSTVYDLAGLRAAFPGKGLGAVSANPLFVDAEARNLRLEAGSPAVDTGANSAPFDTFMGLYGTGIANDFDETPRPQGSGNDMGAFER